MASPRDRAGVNGSKYQSSLSTRRSRWRTAIGLLLVMGCGATAVLLLDEVMLATSTPNFCATCHEMRPAYASWTTSPHANNARGVVVKCIDCHLPDPNSRIAFYRSKAYHGTKDIIAHVLMATFKRPYDREQHRRIARKQMTNSPCQRCHQDLLATGMSRGAMLAHRSTLYPRKGYEKSCLECHPNVGHREARLFAALR